MRLTTIWTIPAMTLRERLHRTREWFWLELANRLPKRLVYWTVITAAVRTTDTYPAEVTALDILKHLEPTP